MSFEQLIDENIKNLNMWFRKDDADIASLFFMIKEMFLTGKNELMSDLEQSSLVQCATIMYEEIESRYK
jgi:hypothetical protein